MTIMSSNDIDKSYVSPYDQFLSEFDACHSKSDSQVKEHLKHQKIAAMRDNSDYSDEKTQIWEDF